MKENLALEINFLQGDNSIFFSLRQMKNLTAWFGVHVTDSVMNILSQWHS